MINNIIALVGCISIISVSILLIAWAWSSIADANKMRQKRLFDRTMILAKMELGRRLITDSYWFSGNEQAFKVTHMIGRHLLINGSYDIDKLREELKTYEVR